MKGVIEAAIVFALLTLGVVFLSGTFMMVTMEREASPDCISCECPPDVGKRLTELKQLIEERSLIHGEHHERLRALEAQHGLAPDIVSEHPAQTVPFTEDDPEVK